MKISIYQLLPRLFGVKNNKPVVNGWLKENGSGKFNYITKKALEEIKNLGITHVWFTGVIEHATCEYFPEYNIGGQHPSVVKGKAGSPYAITDYYDVNAYLAEDIPNRMNEFEQLIERTHKSGLKAIIDFVPNHVARQYHSDIFPEKDFGINDDKSVVFSSKNDFYYIPNEKLHISNNMGTDTGTKHKPYKEFPAKATGNDKFDAYPDINDWYETVKLNYGIDYFSGRKTFFEPHPPLWDKMVDILKFWCNKGVDGIRCDMAEMVPVEFWEYAIAKVKKHYPDVIFIAEVYNPAEYDNYIKRGGFDYLYDKVGLYDTLRNIVSHNTPAHDITHCWQSLNGLDNYMLRFLENHDEQRIASHFFAGKAEYAIPAMAVTALMNKGPVMTYFGQEVGEPATGVSGFSGDDGRTTIFDFFNVPEFQKWENEGKYNSKKLSKEQNKLRKTYKQLLNFTINNKAISDGNFYDLMWTNHFEGGPDTRYIYLFLRYTKREKLLIVVNFHKTETQNFKFKIPEDALHLLGYNISSTISFNNVLSKKTVIEEQVVKIAYEGIALESLPLSYNIYRIE